METLPHPRDFMGPKWQDRVWSGDMKSGVCKMKCDVMGQNQSHVAKHKMAEICIFPENVKICPFFVFIKNKIFV